MGLSSDTDGPTDIGFVKQSRSTDFMLAGKDTPLLK